MTQTPLPASAAPQMALVVRLGESLHALPIESVEEVLPALPIEPIPGAPSFLRGVVFVRGHWIPVLDAGERLGVRRRPSAESPIVCLSVQGKLIGLEVDEALDLTDLGRGARAGAEDLGVSEGFFAGLLEREGESIRLLNPARLLATEEAARLPQSAPGDEGGGPP